jgi:hypothetical protein
MAELDEHQETKKVVKYTQRVGKLPRKKAVLKRHKKEVEIKRTNPEYD